MQAGAPDQLLESKLRKRKGHENEEEVAFRVLLIVEQEYRIYLLDEQEHVIPHLEDLCYAFANLVGGDLVAATHAALDADCQEAWEHEADDDNEEQLGPVKRQLADLEMVRRPIFA